MSVSEVAWGDDTGFTSDALSTNPCGEPIPPPAGAAGTLSLAWASDGAGGALPALQLSPGADAPWTIEVDLTYSFLGVSATWAVGPFTLATGVSELELVAPAGLSADPRSEYLPGGLTATVVRLDPDTAAPLERWVVSNLLAWLPADGSLAVQSVAQEAALTGVTFLPDESGVVLGSLPTVVVGDLAPDLIVSTPGLVDLGAQP